MSTTLHEQVQALHDKQALTELVHKASRAVDRADGALLISCYWPDAYDDHGMFKGDPIGLLAYLEASVMNPSVGPCQHTLTNLLFEVDEDVAYGECYSESRVIQPDGSVRRALVRFIDRFERRAGEWRIAQRRLILENASPGVDTSSFARGTRDRSDPSYERLGGV